MASNGGMVAQATPACQVTDRTTPGDSVGYRDAAGVRLCKLHYAIIVQPGYGGSYLPAAALTASCFSLAIVAAAGSFRLPDLLRLFGFVE